MSSFAFFTVELQGLPPKGPVMRLPILTLTSLVCLVWPLVAESDEDFVPFDPPSAEIYRGASRDEGNEIAIEARPLAVTPLVRNICSTTQCTGRSGDHTMTSSQPRNLTMILGNPQSGLDAVDVFSSHGQFTVKEDGTEDIYTSPTQPFRAKVMCHQTPMMCFLIQSTRYVV